MSEKIYAWLLRLYPYRFRKAYKEDALRLYRERFRDETGLFRRSRLYFDLLVDVVAGLRQAYQNSYATPAAALLSPNSDGVPTFQVLEREPLPSGSIVVAIALVLVALSGLSFVMTLPIAASPSSNKRMSPIESALQRINRVDPPDSDPREPAEPISPMTTAKAQTPIANAVAGFTRPTPTPLGTGKQNHIVHSLSQNSNERTVNSEQARRAFEVSVMREKREESLDEKFFAGQLPAPVLATSYSNYGKSRNPVPSGQAQVEDASTAMIHLFQTHQIVMFGETHGNKQEYEWLCKLVKTTGFADNVDDIVVEFGNSLYQKSVDRYIAGENVPIEQVQKAWRNMIGAVGPVSPVYAWLYKAVRDSNLQRRGGHKIRLLLGDPYGDWGKINNAEDLGPYLAHRDQWYAQVVKDEVLARNHRALLIMGAGHFLRRNGPGVVEQAIRAAGVPPYLVVLGTNVIGGYDDLDRRFDTWPVPAIVPLSGNWVGNLPAMPVLTGGSVAANSLKIADLADAMLYLGQRDSLTAVNVPRSELVGTTYGKEIERRLMIQTGQAMDFAQESENPQFQRVLQQATNSGVHPLPPNAPRSIKDPLPPRPPSQ
jgi:hypothetical protein